MDVVEKPTDIVTAAPSAESEVKVENDKKVLFKKPQIGLIIGPRRGKVIGKCRSLEPTIEIKTLGTATDTLSISEPTAALVKEEVNNSGEVEKDSVKTEIEKSLATKTTSESKSSKSKRVPGLSPAQQLALDAPIPYKEPKWGGCPKTNYNFEVLKSGKILEHVDLSEKSFFVFGRLPNADVMMAHPTISRYHAVVQYRADGSTENPAGFYLYDLDSTHGTFLNKNRIKPNMYVRLHVGHVLRFGCSSRLFVLQGPEEDEEEESELTLTQIKENRKNEILRRIRLGEAVSEEEAGEGGVDWGMGEDADEETDLSVNPFASTNNEELYLDDPKKTLRGWFEREGIELEYDVEERGVAQFLCRVELPVESARNGVVMAEAVVQGKKKEAVVQCALEACRILDRYGLLRQATHESKKRKARDWESEDFYDSDEDTFLDRTGTVEQKRRARMRAAGRREVLTYRTLVEQHDKVCAELKDVERQWTKATRRETGGNSAKREDEDELDAYMKNLGSGVGDKLLISKLKSSLTSLRSEESRLRRLVNVARPADLPELMRPTAEGPTSNVGKMSAILGRARKQIRSKQAARVSGVGPRGMGGGGDEEEEEDEQEELEVKEDRHIIKVRGDGVRADQEEEEEDGENGKELPETRDRPREAKRVEITSVRETNKRTDGYSSGSRLGEEQEEDDEEPTTTKGPTEKEVERRKKRNRMRMMQRNAKMKKESNAEWSEVAASDPSLYSTWVPPAEQSGDGRTGLNEKLGY